MEKIRSKLRVRRLDALVLAILYIVVGVANIYVLALSDFTFMPVGAFAVLSFIAAYGLWVTKKWVVWIMAILFFPAAMFGVTTLFFSVSYFTFYPSVEILLFHLAFIFYVVIYLLSFVYVAAKRKTFQ